MKPKDLISVEAIENLKNPIQNQMDTPSDSNKANTDRYIKKHLYKLIEKHDNIYEEYFNTDEMNTHIFITRNAIQLAQEEYGNINNSLKENLLSSCRGPDQIKKLRRLVMEGHFYGQTGNGAKGNFLQKIFNGELIFSEKFITILQSVFNDDLFENAATNVAKYANEYISEFNDTGSQNKFGWAIHYLQDITAPPHAGNIPNVLHHDPLIHLVFENYAKNYIFESNTAKFTNPAKPLFNDFLSILNLDHLIEYADHIHTLSEPSVELFLNIYNEFEKTSIIDILNIFSDDATISFTNWNQAVDNTIPIAIASSAALIVKISKKIDDI